MKHPSGVSKIQSTLSSKLNVNWVWLEQILIWKSFDEILFLFFICRWSESFAPFMQLIYPIILFFGDSSGFCFCLLWLLWCFVALSCWLAWAFKSMPGGISRGAKQGKKFTRIKTSYLTKLEFYVNMLGVHITIMVQKNLSLCWTANHEYRYLNLEQVLIRESLLNISTNFIALNMSPQFCSKELAWYIILKGWVVYEFQWVTHIMNVMCSTDDGPNLRKRKFTRQICWHSLVGRLASLVLLLFTVEIFKSVRANIDHFDKFVQIFLIPNIPNSELFIAMF